MEHAITTTPFGRRPMSLAMVASQAAARNVPKDRRVNKWAVFHTVRDAREALGASDRGLAILNALLSFYPENDLCAENGFVVWPSNEQLIATLSEAMGPVDLKVIREMDPKKPNYLLMDRLRVIPLKLVKKGAS